MHIISSDPTVTFDWETSPSKTGSQYLTITRSEFHSADEGETVLDRKEAHELHAFLQVALGLTHPTPTSPLTASKAARYPNVNHLPGGQPSDVV